MIPYTISRWLRPLRSGCSRPARRRTFRPRCEALEDRRVPSYVPIDLGALAPSAINNRGVVAGSANGHAVVMQAGIVTDLGALGGATSAATAINNAGQVVGSAVTPDGYGHAFLVTPEDTDGDGSPDLWFRDSDMNGINDLMTDLGTLGGPRSMAKAINNLGQVVGRADTSATAGSYRAFLWDSAAGMRDLGMMASWQTASEANAINDSGQVAGTAYQLMGGSILNRIQAFRWDPAAGSILLGSLPYTPVILTGNQGTSKATGINQAGQVVGISGVLYGTSITGRIYLANDAFLWQGGTMNALGFTTQQQGHDYDVSINNAGQVVGANYLWQNGGHANLNDSLDPSQGWTISTTADINDFGQMVGNGTHNGVSPSYFLLPAGLPPSITIGNVSVIEGDTGSVNAVFTVSLSAPLDQVMTVDFATVDGTAKAGKDYVATSGTLTFNPGETTKTISVAVLGDLIDEYDETFTVQLSNSTGALVFTPQAVGTILDNDAPPQITISDVTMKEGKANTYTSFVFTVSLSAPSEKTVTVNYQTADGTATAGGKQADYYSAGGYVTFNPGETTKTITITVVGDNRKEADEVFFLNLSAATNATILRGQGVGTILNDD